MVHIKTKKGLDIPIIGKPEGQVQTLPTPQKVALNLAPFEETKFKLLVKKGDEVKIGQPLALDKKHEGVVFTSPAAGIVDDVLRGEKRRLLNIVIRIGPNEEYENVRDFKFTGSREDFVAYLKDTGLLPRIRQRPFNLPADPTKTPRCIFVKAIESAPFTPSAEMQVEGNEQAFEEGLKALNILTDGDVHLVYSANFTSRAFTEAKDVVKHTAEGPHPVGNSSVHIHFIDPIRSPEEVVWTLTALDVIRIGHQVSTGKPYLHQVVSIAGPGILDGKRGFFKVRQGYPIGGLVAGRVPKGIMRYISGDPLTGEKVEIDDYLGYSDTVFTVIPENTEREFLHFFRLGLNKFSASKAYFSGHVSGKEYEFTTSNHGEHRAFVTNMPYDQVMPMRIPTMTLTKAVMAEDYELAEQLGLLEVASEDFALSTFVCPSKIEIAEIIKNGLSAYAHEVVH